MTTRSIQRLHEGALPPILPGARAAPPSCGAHACFAGIVRDQQDGRAVSGIRYHAHRALAEKRLEDIEREAALRFGAIVELTHAIGELVVGDESVRVSVYAPHRAAAFDACRWAIDTIKQAVPIWKEERYVDGESRFLAGVPLTQVNET